LWAELELGCGVGPDWNIGFGSKYVVGGRCGGSIGAVIGAVIGIPL